ncbi:MAG TPA: hypothetical protein VGM17_01630 [Rhizomicrobium sp.]|jgi:hypothetical protein
MTKWLLPMVLLSLTTLIGEAFLPTASHAAKVVESSAQAWVWVPPDQQEQFVTEVCEFARQKGFKCNSSKPPSPNWQMVGIVVVTPQQNEISVINATARDKFAAGITVFQPEPEWPTYWNDFRTFVSARHKWRDIR